ncbi:MAG TPA: hypothetical protein VMJ12_17295 [Candidatus Acidoferrales bacterium]|nr:hypothetical protein [Candidatus Acidoferrales bacterium]
MTIYRLAKLSFLTILSLAAALIVGCETTKPIDWNSRVGTYTFDQAVTEMGPPDKQTALSDGKLVAQWITHRYGGSSFSVGTGFYTGPVGVGVGQTTGSAYPDRILTLTFGTNLVLVAYSKNY